MKLFGLAVAGAVAAGFGAARAAAMESAGQMHGAGQGGMQMGSMMSAQQMQRMMGELDTMMARSSTMMHDMSAMHGTSSWSETHGAMMTAMQGMLDNMNRFEGQLKGMMADPALSKNPAAATGFDRACKDLEQMNTAYQSLTKNVTDMMKGIDQAPRK